MQYLFKPKNVCCVQITFDINDGIVSNVSFLGGCNGNLKAISKLVEGMSVEEIENKLLGNTCGRRPTSCADQFAIAVREAYNSQKQIV